MPHSSASGADFAPPSVPSAPSAADAPGLPWRGLAPLALAVLLAHLALLGLTPLATGPKPSPLAGSFITRTIALEPPAAAEPAPEPPPAQPPVAARKPAPQPPRPRPTARPRPAAVPEAVTPEFPVPMVQQPEPEASAPPATPAAEAQSPVPGAQAETNPAQAAAPPPGAAAGAGNGAGDGEGNNAGNGSNAGNPGSTGTGGQTAGNIAGPIAMQAPGSVRLAFAATAQQGAQPKQGVFGVLDWRQDGRHYEASLSWTVLFITIGSQHSSGLIGPGGIEPLRYSDKRRTSIFDRDQGRILFENNAPSMRLLAGAQDRLSIVMQLGGMLAAEPARYPQGSVIAIQTVGPKDAEIWTFNVGEEQELDLPAGRISARLLTRNPRAPVDDKIELWLAPSLGWLPVRIRQTQPNGDFIDLQLRSRVAQAAEMPTK